MPIEERALYARGNGDRWSLARDTQTGTVFVRHRPNQASGGQISDQDLGAFLAQGGMPPEKQELLRLIGELLDQNGDADSTRWSSTYSFFHAPKRFGQAWKQQSGLDLLSLFVGRSKTKTPLRRR